MSIVDNFDPNVCCDCLQPNCRYCDADGSIAKAHDESLCEILKEKKMKFKKGVEPMYTSDFWYDATKGGYIKPEKFLEEEDAKKVSEAIRIVREFEDGLQENELLIDL